MRSSNQLGTMLFLDPCKESGSNLAASGVQIKGNFHKTQNPSQILIYMYPVPADARASLEYKCLYIYICITGIGDPGIGNPSLA